MNQIVQGIIILIVLLACGVACWKIIKKMFSKQ